MQWGVCYPVMQSKTKGKKGTFAIKVCQVDKPKCEQSGVDVLNVAPPSTCCAKPPDFPHKTCHKNQSSESTEQGWIERSISGENIRFGIWFLSWCEAQCGAAFLSPLLTPLSGTESVDHADWQTDGGSFDKNTTGSLAFKSHGAQQPKHRNQ